MSMSRLNVIPRVSLSHSPTPLEAMPKLSKLLNRNIFVKRDDCTGLSGGGNKTRKLEYLVADALAANADTLVTVGGEFNQIMRDKRQLQQLNLV